MTLNTEKSLISSDGPGSLCSTCLGNKVTKIMYIREIKNEKKKKLNTKILCHDTIGLSIQPFNSLSIINTIRGTHVIQLHSRDAFHVCHFYR